MKNNFSDSKDVNPNYTSYLTDESALVHGHAEKIFFPSTEEELQKIVVKANQEKIPITISGGGTGLTGGRAPLGGWIIATDEMTKLVSYLKNKKIFTDKEINKTFEYHIEKINEELAYLTLPVSITIKAIQNLVRELGWFYPPDPTERSAFIGGTVVTNASGARSFKYGATREWTQKIRVILPDGTITVQDRNNQEKISDNVNFQIKAVNKTYSIPRPTYELPDVRKNVAGPVIKDSYQPIDIFIGSDGIFGILSEVTIKVIKPPVQIISMILFCKSFNQALDFIDFAQNQRLNNTQPIPLSIELIDNNAVDLLKPVNPQIPENSHTIIYLEQDIYDKEKIMNDLEFWVETFDRFAIEDTWVEDSYTGIEKHKEFRHSLPETVNSLVKRNGQAKLGTDYSVPSHLTKELYEICKTIGDKFQDYRSKRGEADTPSHVLWAHAGDNHVHLNFLPKTDNESEFAKKLMVEMMTEIVKLGGSISAEHGLGKKKFLGKNALYYQYSEEEISQIKQIKGIFDPNKILNIGVLF
ncbi:MAG: FAD-binding oxidoreductase [Candidatus Hodarchaeales archaeon]|jgi:D-lactate dehydrogenase (cytochrome)